MKTCTKCEQRKEIDDFYTSGKNSSGNPQRQSMCKVCNLQKKKNDREKNKLYYRNYARKYYKESDQAEKMQQYYIDNKEKIVKKSVAWLANKLATDPQYKLKHSLRGQVKAMLDNRNSIKNGKTFDLLGYTTAEFRAYFVDDLKRFEGTKYHLDHKIPMSWFQDDTPLSIIFHLHNLQLLNELDNWSKHNTFMHAVSPEFMEQATVWIKDKYMDKTKSPQ